MGSVGAGEGFSVGAATVVGGGVSETGAAVSVDEPSDETVVGATSATCVMRVWGVGGTEPNEVASGDGADSCLGSGGVGAIPSNSSFLRSSCAARLCNCEMVSATSVGEVARTR